ncbi:hypothetical protein VSH64_37955 [Amycolatopsis rhabdoformis]|uniref:UDP-N-acetyl glucosamine 2-epimerase n=1 Tax=Amycolatopsis rhabdoformis TaxID=1448059 RepID=A0ABZ1I4L3_9PSEU|nr:hypothetical protein [Amycolatopsis rhabdoformis]WSE28570.1 hypothetical protein VSH64_37955 [Amycolatopsis rhabdoformis]
MSEKPDPPPSFRPKVPVDPAYDHWLTYGVEKRILVVTRTVTTVTRLLDILSLLEDDHRVQPVFTFDDRRPAVFSAGLTELLTSLGAAVVPWSQARTAEFDLAVAASENDDLAELRCPVLLVPHGIGHQKYYPRTKTISGLNPARLRGDRLHVGLSHGNQLGHVRGKSAVVIGDPCHDRMLASAHRVPHFRRVLGAADRTHVVLASTWGPQSLIGSNPSLPHRFLAELPLDEYRVSLVLHPGVWSAHSPLQVRAVLASARRGGLTLIPPQRGWQATILSADCLVSDCGSMPLYASAAGVPVVIGSPVADTVVAGSPLADLVARAPRLDESALPDQVAAAIASGPVAGPAAEAVEYPGKCAEILRALLYELLDLPEPSRPAAFPPVDDPVPEYEAPTALRVGVEAAGDDLLVRRFPASVPGAPLPGQHIVAHAELATLAELEGAAVVHRSAGADFAGWAAETARRRPNARLLAETAPGLCRVWTDGVITDLPAAVDPLVLASAAHWRTVRGLPLTDLRVR